MNAAQSEVTLAHETHTPTKVAGASHWTVTIGGKTYRLASGKAITVPVCMGVGQNLTA